MTRKRKKRAATVGAALLILLALHLSSRSAHAAETPEPRLQNVYYQNLLPARPVDLPEVRAEGDSQHQGVYP